MTENERRLAAIEMAIIEVFAWRSPDDLDDASRSIRNGLAGSCAEERSVRLGALALIDDARRRFKPDMPGSFMRCRPSSPPASRLRFRRLATGRRRACISPSASAGAAWSLAPTAAPPWLRAASGRSGWLSCGRRTGCGRRCEPEPLSRPRHRVTVTSALEAGLMATAPQGPHSTPCRAAWPSTSPGRRTPASGTVACDSTGWSLAR